MKIRITQIILILPILSSCIGTDMADGLEMEEELTLSPKSLTVLIGEEKEIESSYTDMQGEERDVDLSWSSEDEIIAVVSDGVVTGIAKGQTTVSASFGPTESNEVRVTVISSAEDVAEIRIEASKMEIDVDEMLDLMANVYDGNEEIIEGPDIDWTSHNPEILSVSQEGVATGLAVGITSVTASTEGVTSSPFTINVGGAQARTATLMGANGYNSEGEARLFTQDDELILELGEDFKADIAAGTFIYLSNSTSGSQTRNSGLELGEITEDGFYSFNVTGISPETEISDYSHVIVLCKPFSITFGYGEFEN